MAFREVAMFEVKEVIRLFGKGVPKKAIARAVGVDVKTVCTCLAAAEPLGLAGLYRFAAIVDPMAGAEMQLDTGFVWSLNKAVV